MSGQPVRTWETSDVERVQRRTVWILAAVGAPLATITLRPATLRRALV